MTITEKVAYLKGLVEGLGVDTETKEGRIIKAVVEVLDDMALTVSDVEDGLSELSEQVDAIDEDLEDIENDFYGDEDYDEDECDEGCYEVTCSNCGKKVYLDDEILADGEMTCPNCGEKLEFDFGGEDEEEDENGKGDKD